MLGPDPPTYLSSELNFWGIISRLIDFNSGTKTRPLWTVTQQTTKAAFMFCTLVTLSEVFGS